MYQALSQIGVPPRLKQFDDYDWHAKTTRPRVAIVPDARAITEDQIRNLEAFVDNGNTLLITGLTGLYDPHARAWPLAGFPLSRVTGADLKEVHFIGPDVDLYLKSPNVTLPSHLWISSIDSHSAQIAGERDGEVTATVRKTAKSGAVIWIPSPVDIGAWLRGTEPLAAYLQSTLSKTLNAEPFRFPSPQPGCVMRVLIAGNASVSVLTNGGDSPVKCRVQHPEGLHGQKLWGDIPTDNGTAAIYSLPPRGTAVTLWQ
jgi:hypothetical protein